MNTVDTHTLETKVKDMYERVAPNPQYRFISDQANGATRKYEVQSISLVAVKP